MNRKEFSKNLTRLRARYEELVTRPNRVDEDWYNGCFERYVYPVLTNEHIPLEWRYDWKETTANPSSPWRRARTASTTSASAAIRS